MSPTSDSTSFLTKSSDLVLVLPCGIFSHGFVPSLLLLIHFGSFRHCPLKYSHIYHISYDGILEQRLELCIFLLILSFTGPKAFLNIFLSNVKKLFSSSFLSGHVFASYRIIGRINVIHNLFFKFFDNFRESNM